MPICNIYIFSFLCLYNRVSYRCRIGRLFRNWSRSWCRHLLCPAEQTENTAETDSTENDKKNTDSKTKKSEQPEQNRQKNNSGLFIVLALAAAVGIGGYYYKVILPKKKLEQADDLDDFDFEDEDTETVVNEDDVDSE